MNIPEQFSNKIEVAENGCWNWTGTITYHGYGRVRVNGKRPLAHRAVYEMLVKAVPEGLEIDHLCRNRRCVNPEHLEPIPHRLNVRRGNAGKYLAAKTHCPQNHPYDEENTYQYVSKRGTTHRICRTCNRAKARAFYHKKKGTTV